VQPEWDSIYKDLPVDPTVRDQLLPILKKIHFQVVVGPEGALSVIPETDVATAEVANRVKGTVSDTEKILTGFLHTWLLFAIAPPLPEVNSDYQVRDIDGKYRLNYKEGSGDVSTSMKHDFAIEELSFSSAEFTSTVLPNLLLDEKGFLLAGYSTSYIGKSNSLQMSVTIEYQEVQGIKMPSTVTAIVPLPAGKVTPSFKFSEYQVKTH
jgi:hypothetical protein